MPAEHCTILTSFFSKLKNVHKFDLMRSLLCIRSHHVLVVQEGVLAALDDSEEFEFNLDQTDVQTGLRHRSTSQREPRTQMTHPLAQYSTSAPIRPPLEEMEGELSGHRTPPPAYDVVVTESEYQYMYPKLEEELYQQKGVPKSSSTPLLYGQK